MALETPRVGGATNTVRFDVKSEHPPGFVAIPAVVARGRARRAARRPGVGVARPSAR